jgi:ABC-type phosphate/phosphonate transport system substrate-binding protein
MNSETIAALPMYDFPELSAAHDALWAAIAERLQAAGVAAPLHLTRTLGHFDVWKHPGLLLGQGCEYPLAKSFSQYIRPVATPRYAVPGCVGARYRSAIVVRHDDPAHTIADLRLRRCVINEVDSNSGMNLLRAAIAPVSGGQPFFQSVERSGSHLRSADMVAAGLADVAALDCVSYAHFRRLYPARMSGLRVLAWTDPSPCLPYITARSTSEETLAALRASLADVVADAAVTPLCEPLFLEGFDFAPAEDYAEVLGLERRAHEHGYVVLA